MKIMNLYELALLLRAKLKMAKWPFNRYGFPVFPREVILEEPPTLIEPIQRIRCCKNPKETLLCSFADDKFIRRRLQNLFDEIGLYRNYYGFGKSLSNAQTRKDIYSIALQICQRHFDL